MLTILLGLVVGVGMIYYRISGYQRKNQAVELLISDNKFECLDYASGALIFLGLATMIPLGCLAYFSINYDEVMIAFMLAFSLMFIAEIINARQSYKFYYHKTGCIVNGRLLNYKSIKSIYRKTSGRYLLITYNNEQLNVAKAAVEKITEISGLKVTK